MFDGPNFALISDVDQDKICLVHMKDPYLIDTLSPIYKTRYKKEIKQR